MVPVIHIHVREGVLPTAELKAEAIDAVSTALANVIDKNQNNSDYKKRSTVIIEEHPNQNWGREGKQVRE